jgi:membrane-associated phospholipid phosphatase
VHRKSILAALALLVLTGYVFALAPELDLASARLFLNEGAYVGVTPTGEVLRILGYQLPFWILGLAVLAWALGRLGLSRWATPSGRAVLFLALTLAIGPGLLVNVALKDHSHRPRPVQTLELGGKWPFRPWYRFDGQCQRNCSFVSGEASSAFWTLAPALLAPPPVRPLAVGAALVFGTGVAALRMAFGGHYLSDSLISGLLTILLVLVLHRAFFGRMKRRDVIYGRDPGLRRTDAPL